jgi:hypothetical protein
MHDLKDQKCVFKGATAKECGRYISASNSNFPRQLRIAPWKIKPWVCLRRVKKQSAFGITYVIECGIWREIRVRT